MKQMLSGFLMLFLWVASVNAQVLIGPEKLPTNTLNFMVTNDMGRRGVSEQKNIATLMGEEADFNRINLIAVAGDPIHDDGVKSTDDSEWKDKYENIYTASSLMNIPVCGPW